MKITSFTSIITKFWLWLFYIDAQRAFDKNFALIFVLMQFYRWETKDFRLIQFFKNPFKSYLRRIAKISWNNGRQIGLTVISLWALYFIKNQCLKTNKNSLKINPFPSSFAENRIKTFSLNFSSLKFERNPEVNTI